MFEQITNAGESILTVATKVGFDSGVRSGVSNQTLSVGEGFIALITLVRTFASVHPFVHFELTLVQKARATVVAQVTFDPGMLDHVCVEGRLGQIFRMTHIALVFLLFAALGLYVDLQLRCRSELLPASGAYIVLPIPAGMFVLDVIIVVIFRRELGFTQPAPEHTVLFAFMFIPIPVGGERLHTDRAQETSRWLVAQQVPQIVGLVQEHLLTNATGIMKAVQVVIGFLGALFGFRFLYLGGTSPFTFRRFLVVLCVGTHHFCKIPPFSSGK